MDSFLLHNHQTFKCINDQNNTGIFWPINLYSSALSIHIAKWSALRLDNPRILWVWKRKYWGNSNTFLLDWLVMVGPLIVPSHFITKKWSFVLYHVNLSQKFKGQIVKQNQTRLSIVENGCADQMEHSIKNHWASRSRTGNPSRTCGRNQITFLYIWL